MRSSRIILMLLLVLGVASSFDIINYLYSNESINSVTTEKFTLNSIEYSVIRIGGNESFLLKDGEPMEDQAIIENVLRDYNIQQYYPTETELKNIYNLLKAYNDSKNNGEVTTLPGKEDAACRYALFIDGHVKVGIKPVECVDDATCKQNAMLFYSAYGQALGLGSYTTVLGPLKNYSFATYGSEKIMNESFQRLASIDESSIYPNLLFIKNSIPTLRGYEEDIENSVFRFPRMSDPDDVRACKGVCYGICPPLDYNETILNRLDANISVLVTRVANFGTKIETAGKIYNSTIARMESYSKEQNATHYSAIFLPLYSKANKVISFTDSTLVHVTNGNLTIELSQLKNLHSKINSSIANQEFSTIDQDLAEYSTLITKVNASAQEVFSVYNDSVTAKNRAGILLFVLESRDLDPITKSHEEKIRDRIFSIDASFRNGSSESEYTVLATNYSQASQEAAGILRTSRENPASIALLSFRNFAKDVNNGLATFIQSSGLMSISEVPQNKAAVFGGFSLLSFFSFGSMSFLVFMGILMVGRSARRSVKYVFLAIFVIALLSASAFSVFLYVYLDRTSSNAEAEEYLIDLEPRNNVSLFVDLSIATSDGKDAMKACGNSMAESIKSGNHNAFLYIYDSSGCVKSAYRPGSENVTAINVASADCLKELGDANAAIILNYSTKFETPKFSTTYSNRAYLSADSSYYNTCPISSIFK